MKDRAPPRLRGYGFEWSRIVHSNPHLWVWTLHRSVFGVRVAVSALQGRRVAAMKLRAARARLRAM